MINFKPASHSEAMVAPQKRVEASDDEEEHHSSRASDEASQFSESSDDEDDVILSAAHGVSGVKWVFTGGRNHLSFRNLFFV